MDSGILVEIKYELLPEDIVALRLFFLNEATDGRRRRANRLWAAGCIAAAAFGVMAGFLDWEYQPQKTAAVLAVLAPFILLAVGVPTALLLFQETEAGVRRKVRRETGQAWPNQLRRLLGPKRLVVSDRGFRLFGDGIESYREWRIVPKVLRGFDHLYVCESFSRKQMVAVVIPGRGFPSRVAFDDFCGLIERCWRAANLEAAVAEQEVDRASDPAI